MTWLVWRRQRVAFLLVAAVVLVWGRQAYLALPERGDDLSAPGLTRFGPFWGFSHSFLLITPLLLGVLAGAGLFSRDVEQQTHLFVLTHGVGRRRWWASGVVISAAVVVLAAAVLSVVAAWAFAPMDVETGYSVLSLPTFEVSGIVPLAYTVFAFALAAVAGLLTRNALAAIVITVVGYGATLIVLAAYARGHYLPPEVVLAPIGGADVPGMWVDATYVDRAGTEVEVESAYGPIMDCLGSRDLESCYGELGVVAQKLRFQPDERYWAFQAIESAILLLLSAGVFVLSAVRLRKDVPV